MRINTHIVLWSPRSNLRYSISVLLLIALVALSVLPSNVAAAGIAISAPQTISQGNQASYSVTVSPAGPAGQSYQLSISGVVGYFAPNPVGPCGLLTCPVTTLVVDASALPTYCPGTYSFTVAARSTSTVDAGSAAGSVTVLQVGPPLQVAVSTDKPAYTAGQTVTISVSATRPAEGNLIVTPPSGSPKSYSFAFTGATYGATKTFVASQPYGTYTVSVQADDYCYGVSTASSAFSVGPNTYDVPLQIAGVPSQYSAGVQVDGQNQGTISGSQTRTLSFTIGSTHTITVDQYVPGANGVRYYSADNTWSVSSASSHTFNYQTQYQLNVTTDPAGLTQVSGGGWFNSGDSAQTSQAAQTVPGSAGVQYVFQNWVVDGVTQNGNQITVMMGGPHTAVANYITQYLLTVGSAGGLGSPQGGGYHDAGSVAQFSVTSPVGYLVQQVFVQWQGDYSGTSPQGSVTMNAPKTVTATWTTSYTNVYVAGGAVVALILIAAVLGMRRRSSKGAAKEAKQEEEPKDKQEK